MKRVVSPGSMHDTGCLGLVHWDDPEGWNGDGGGRRVQDGEHMYTCDLSFFNVKVFFFLCLCALRHRYIYSNSTSYQAVRELINKHKNES